MTSAENKAVFLSYASQDAEAARRIAETLRAAGIEVWFDQNELVGGDAWDAKIRKQIAECALFVPIISAATQARLEGYFRIEWKLAARRTHGMATAKAFLLPVVIDATHDTEAHVPDEFREVQWTRLPGGEGAAVEKFGAQVGKLLGGHAVGGALRPDINPGAAESGHKAPPTAPLKKPSRPWLVPAILGAAALVGLAIWRPWKHSATTSPALSASLPAPSAPVAAPLSEAKRLVRQAQEILLKAELGLTELDTAGLLCERAASLDSSDPEVWATASEVETWRAYFGGDVTAERRESARAKAARALNLSPQAFAARRAQSVYVVCVVGGPAASEAEPALRALLRERPTDPLSLLVLGLLLRGVGKGDEAVTVWEKLGTLPGQAACAYNEIAWLLASAGRYDEANRAIDRSIDAAPTTSNVGLKVFLAQNWLGDLDVALAALKKLPTAKWLDDRALATAVRVFHWRHEPQEILKLLDPVPRNWIVWGIDGPKAAITGDAHAMRNEMVAARNDWTTALALVEQRLAATPNDWQLNVWKAYLHAALGQSEAAARALALARESSVEAGKLVRQSLAGFPNRALGYNLLPRLVSAEEQLADLEQDERTRTRVLTPGSLRHNPSLAAVRQLPGFASLLARVADNRATASVGLTASATGVAKVSEKSVAVLAFADNSPGHDSESFSEGISEELGVVLGKVPGLRVAGWNSTLSFKGKNVSEAEIAQKLGVTHIVSGSVRRDGTEVRITARLVNAADGFQLWSDSFKREAKGIFAVQDEIAGLIAEYLKLKLDVDARRTRVVNPEAHRLLLEGRHFWNQRNDDGFARAEVAFLKAIEIDPTFPEAHVGLAGVYVIRGTYQALEDSAREVTEDFRRARTAATKAVELGPDLAEAHAVLAYTLFTQGEKAAAGREFERALALNPNSATTVTWSSVMESMSGQLDAALGSYAKAATLDPLWFINLHLYAEALFFASRYDEALQVAERAAALRSDDFIPNLGLRAQILFALGRRAEAVAMARTIRTQLHRDTRWIADAHAIHVLRQCGEAKEAADYAAEVLRQLEAQSPVRAPIFAALGSFDEALPTIGGTRITMRRYLFWEPIWDPWRDDPRFQAALAQLGCVEEYKTARATLARLKTESAAKK